MADLSTTPGGMQPNSNPLTTGNNLGVDLASILSLFQGANGTYTNQGKTAANMADPLSSLNSTTLPMLEKLLTDPNSITGTPGYQFAVGQGQDAIKAATNAATGSSDPTRTGSLGPALAKYTEGYALQDYNQQIQNLLQTLPSAPGAAAAALTQGQANNNTSLGQGIAGIAQLLTSLNIPQAAQAAIMKMFNGGGGAGGGTTPDLTNPDASIPYTPGTGPDAGGTVFNPDNFGYTPPSTDWTSGFDLNFG